jgi:hypothetical protein
VYQAAMLMVLRDEGTTVEAPLLNCLRAPDIEFGLCLNFGPAAKIKRVGVCQ